MKTLLFLLLLQTASDVRVPRPGLEFGTAFLPVAVAEETALGLLRPMYTLVKTKSGWEISGLSGQTAAPEVGELEVKNGRVTGLSIRWPDTPLPHPDGHIIASQLLPAVGSRPCTVHAERKSFEGSIVERLIFECDSTIAVLHIEHVGQARRTAISVHER